MQIEIRIDESYPEPKIIILTAAVTEEINRIADRLSKETPRLIFGCKDERIEVIEQDDLVRVYANGGKVYAVTNRGEYTLHLRLYEMEERLNESQFVRISNSEMINFKQVEHFDLSFTGTIRVKLMDGTTTYVSRRYVPKIKRILGF